jgi:hypothetical protein
MNYIYILQEREHINANIPIFKIGKTKQENVKRIKQYPKGSRLILQSDCFDCDKLERKIIELFKKKYIQKKDVGLEYFEGNIDEMKIDIFNQCQQDSVLNKNNINSIDWTNDDIVFGGHNNYIKIIDENGKYIILYLTSDCIKNNKISKYNKYVIDCEQDNSLVYISIRAKCIVRLLTQNKIKLNELYNIDNPNFIKLLNSEKCRINIKNMDTFAKNIFIDSSINYTDVIKYTTNMIHKLSIIFGDTIVNDRYIISHNTYDYIDGKSYVKYNLNYKSTIQNLPIINDIIIDVWRGRCNNNEEDSYYLIYNLFKSNKQIQNITEKKPYFHYMKLKTNIPKPIDYNKRYDTIIKNLKKITSNNIQSKYFDTLLYNKYIDVGLHMLINEYYNNINRYKSHYNNVGLYMDSLYKINIMNICIDDIKYNKLINI